VAGQTDPNFRVTGSGRVVFETLRLAGLVTIIGYVDFHDALPGLFLAFPPLLLATYHGRLLGATTAAAGLAIVAIWSTFTGHGTAFAGGDVNSKVTNVQWATGRPARWPELMEATRFRMTRVVLAAAHLDSDPTNNRLKNLRALCQRCHMLYGRPHHLAQSLDHLPPALGGRRSLLRPVPRHFAALTSKRTPQRFRSA
jgi:hypothetical protein